MPALIVIYHKFLKGRVHCFLMQFVMKKCFLLNPKKNLAQISKCVLFRNDKTNLRQIFFRI